MRFKSKGYIRVCIYTTSYTASQSKYLKTQDSIVVRYKTILLTIARFTRNRSSSRTFYSPRSLIKKDRTYLEYIYSPKLQSSNRWKTRFFLTINLSLSLLTTRPDKST